MMSRGVAEAQAADATPTPTRLLRVARLGLTPYREAWALQRALVALRKADEIEDTLLLLEHPPVITLGRNTGADSLLWSEEHLAERGVSLVTSDRGGDATYHGPGQLVAYPILDLKPDMADIPRFVRTLEQVMLDVMESYGLVGGRVETAPGAWLLAADAPAGSGSIDRKLGAVGARVSRWVTHHGVALNINTHLPHFELIVPCGISDKGVSSLAHELGRELDFEEAMARFERAFAARFRRELRPITRAELPTVTPLEEGAEETL